MDMMTDQVSGWLSSLETDSKVNIPLSYSLPHRDNDQYSSHQYSPPDRNHDASPSPSKSPEPVDRLLVNGSVTFDSETVRDPIS